MGLIDQDRLPNWEAVNQGVEQLDVVPLDAHGSISQGPGPRQGQVPRNSPRAEIGQNAVPLLQRSAQLYV